MFEKLKNVFKGFGKKEKTEVNASKNTAKERLHLVLMQDRANVSADFLELMKQEIIEVIKKYIEVDEGAIDVRLTNKANDDGTTGAPALYANIPIMNIKHEMGKEENQEEAKQEEVKEPENVEQEKLEEAEAIKDSVIEEKKEESKEESKVEENTENNEQPSEEKQEDKKEEISVTNEAK